jgi:S-adenosylmethionine-dependent methyltransferase
MATSPESTFEGAAAIFAEHAKTVRGYVRYQVEQRTLQTVLDASPLRILDVGGGSGIDAAWLVALGHSVTIIEPSFEQQEYAQRRFNFFLNDEQRPRIRTVLGTVNDIDQKEIASYDVVLIHGVAMLQRDPQAFINSALKYAKPGALISLLEKGYYGTEARLIRQVKPKKLHELYQNRWMNSSIGIPVYSFKPEELEALLVAAGTVVEQWYGVRVATDDTDQRVADLDAAEVANIVDTEFEQGHDPSVRANGQMLHFIARKKS